MEPVFLPLLIAILKKGLLMGLLKNLFSIEQGKAKLFGIIFAVCLSGLTLIGIYKVVSNYFSMKTTISQYEESIKQKDNELKKLKDSEEANKVTVRELNQKLKNYQATRVKEKKQINDKITEIDKSNDTDIVKTNSKLNVYYDDIYQIYCKIDKKNCEVQK